MQNVKGARKNVSQMSPAMRYWLQQRSMAVLALPRGWAPSEVTSTSTTPEPGYMGLVGSGPEMARPAVRGWYSASLLPYSQRRSHRLLGAVAFTQPKSCHPEYALKTALKRRWQPVIFWDRTAFTMDTAFAFYVPKQVTLFLIVFYHYISMRAFLLPPLREASYLKWDLCSWSFQLPWLSKASFQTPHSNQEEQHDSHPCTYTAPLSGLGNVPGLHPASTRAQNLSLQKTHLQLASTSDSPEARADPFGEVAKNIQCAQQSAKINSEDKLSSQVAFSAAPATSEKRSSWAFWAFLIPEEAWGSRLKEVQDWKRDRRVLQAAPGVPPSILYRKWVWTAQVIL